MAQIKSPSKCDICDQNTGVYYCYECEQEICKTCRTLHDKVPILKRHTLTDLQHVDRSVSNISTSCKIHGEEFVHFCENCSCLTCSVCATSRHKSHTFIDIESIFNKERTHLTVRKDELVSKIQILSESIKEITSTKLPRIKKYCDEYLYNVENIATELKNIVDFVTEKETEEGKNFHITETQHLTFNLDQHKKVMKEHENALGRIEQNLDEKHKTIFLNSSKTVVQNLVELDNIPEELQPNSIKAFNKEDFLSKVIQQIMTKYDIRQIQDRDKEIQDLQEKLSKRVKETTELKKENETLRKRLEDIELKDGTCIAKRPNLEELEPYDMGESGEKNIRPPLEESREENINRRRRNFYKSSAWTELKKK